MATQSRKLQVLGKLGGSSAGISPRAVAAQTVVTLLDNSLLEAGGMVYASVESVEVANSADSMFQGAIQQVASPPAYGGSVLLYAPSDSGSIVYNDPMTFAEKTVEVSPEVVYIFYIDEETYETKHTTRVGTGLRDLLFNGVTI